MATQQKYVLTFILSVFINNPIHAELEVWLRITTTVVTGTRIPQTFSEITRHVSVIEKEEIKKFYPNSIPELLKYVLSLDIQERCPFGVQADVTMRGSTFQQVLILIDGVRINDSQTAHHNMDLPLTLDDIERIEILHGHGSSLYGSNAFGGVINIITKTPKERESFIQLKIAEYNTQAITLSHNLVWRNYSQKFSFERKSSDGYRYCTDFNILTFFTNSTFEHQKGKLNFTFGLTDKEFGAYDFYTPGKNLPSRESTKTYFAKIENSQKIGKFLLQPKLFFRQHNDKFILDITRPNWYVNDHVKYYYGLETQLTLPIRKIGDLILGCEIVQDEIYSVGLGTNPTNIGLGKHKHPRQAIFTEYHTLILPNINLDLGLRLDNSTWGKQLSPNIALGYSYMFKDFSEGKIRISIGHAFRNPSYIELYYWDPLHKGNSKLKPEETLSYELGLDYICIKNFSSSLTFFCRDQKKLIDWVGETVKGPWEAKNIGEVTLLGIDSMLRFDLYGFRINLKYSWMYSKREKEYISKYVLRHPTNQFSIEFERLFPFNIYSGMKLLYKKRCGEKGYFLLNGKISKNIKNIDFFIEGTNLLNEKYEDIIGVPQPGRWICGGITLRI